MMEGSSASGSSAARHPLKEVLFLGTSHLVAGLPARCSCCSEKIQKCPVAHLHYFVLSNEYRHVVLLLDVGSCIPTVLASFFNQFTSGRHTVTVIFVGDLLSQKEVDSACASVHALSQLQRAGRVWVWSEIEGEEGKKIEFILNQLRDAPFFVPSPTKGSGVTSSRLITRNAKKGGGAAFSLQLAIVVVLLAICVALVWLLIAYQRDEALKTMANDYKERWVELRKRFRYS